MAGANRPAAVPAGYVITPMGYFHPSCVRQLAKGDQIRPEELAIQHADGSFDSMPTCAFDRFTAKGERVAAASVGANSPTIGHNWVEAVYSNTATSYGEMTAQWKVPPAPTSHDGQIIYFFPGMEDYNGVKTIIQPVLGWNSDYANAWGLASWNCCTNGTVYESAPVPTATGHTIFGEMKDTCAAGTLSCSSWNIVTRDINTGATAQLTNSSSQQQTFNWGFSAVLEVYNVSKCSDYPRGGSLELYDLALYNDKFTKVTPAWNLGEYWVGLTPQCNYGTTRRLTYSTLYY
jgi:hypothetical protein